MTAALTQLASSWAAWYSNSAVLRTGVGFAHVAGLVAGGGSAIAVDRATLAASRLGVTERTNLLHALHRAHGVVIAGLGIVTVSGVLLLAANLDTYLGSWVFWVKMACVAILLANGLVIKLAGRHAATGQAGAWARLRYASIVSLAMWFVTTLLGAALPNV